LTNTRTDNGKEQDRDGHAGNQAEFFPDDGKDIVGVCFGQAELHLAAARPGPEQPASGDRGMRLIDLISVAVLQTGSC
jgi:hypothetical protein